MSLLRLADVPPTREQRLKLAENARRLARYKAQQPPWLEEHIAERCWSKPPCQCSACAWRRLHVLEIVRSATRRG